MSWVFEEIYRAPGGPLGGLAWTGQSMLFADTAANIIHMLDPASGQVQGWRLHTNRTNGIAFAPDGALFACQEGGRRVVRMLADGSTVPTLSVLDGLQQNHPRYVAVGTDGAAWFSDCFHELPASGPQIFPMQAQQSVLRLSRKSTRSSSWVLKRMTTDTAAPRGVAVSADGNALFVANSAEGRGHSEVRAYPILADGLAHANVLHRTAAPLEGLHVDAHGRILACVGAHADVGHAAIVVLAADGEVLDRHELAGHRPLHCAYGGAALYVTTAEGRLLCAQP